MGFHNLYNYFFCHNCVFFNLSFITLYFHKLKFSQFFIFTVVTNYLKLNNCELVIKCSIVKVRSWENTKKCENTKLWKYLIVKIPNQNKSINTLHKADLWLWLLALLTADMWHTAGAPTLFNLDMHNIVCFLSFCPSSCRFGWPMATKN